MIRVVECSILLPLHFVHVLVCPRREVKRFIDLSADDTSDLWLTAKKVGRQLESFYIATSLTFTIQDGPRAGQSVPHVHVHIIPRKEGDFEKNDEIYDAIDEREKELKRKLDLDEERKHGGDGSRGRWIQIAFLIDGVSKRDLLKEGSWNICIS